MISTLPSLDPLSMIMYPRFRIHRVRDYTIYHIIVPPCEVRLSILYFGGVNQREGILCQRQLQLRRKRREQKKIFSHSKAPITSSFMSATLNKRRIFIKRCLVFKVSPTRDQRPERKIGRATRFVRID